MAAAVLVTVASGCGEGGWDPEDPEVPELPSLSAVVTLHTGQGDRVVRGPVRVTHIERNVGLMYRRDRLKADEGMLFIMDSDADHSFWMKNTFIPLDIVFITAAGEVAGIAENVTPRTRTSRRVGKVSRFVLELDGGWSNTHGLRAGDKVDITLVPPSE